MLKERITELMDRYESGEENLSAYDVMDELEDALEEEPYEEENLELEFALKDAIHTFVLQRHDAERGGGRIPDGSDEFIAAVERIIGYEN